MPDDNIIEFPDTDNTRPIKWDIEPPSNGNPEGEGDLFILTTATARTLKRHDWQYAINALSRRHTICVEATKAGRLSERSISHMEAQSLLKVISILQGYRDGIDRG